MSVKTRASSVGMMVHDHDGPWHTSVPHYARVISTAGLGSYASPKGTGGSTFTVAGRVILAPIDVPFRCTVEYLGYLAGVQNGNVRMALQEYGSPGFPGLPDGGPVIVESASVAMMTANRIHFISIAPTQLEPGTYYIALQGDDVAGAYWADSDTTYWQHNTLGADRIGRYYNRGGGYGAFTDPCPVTTPYPLLCAWMIITSVP